MKIQSRAATRATANAPATRRKPSSRSTPPARAVAPPPVTPPVAVDAVGEVTSVEKAEVVAASANVAENVAAVPESATAAVEPSTVPSSALTDAARSAADAAVRKVLNEQADARMYDVLEGSRVTITLRVDTLAALHPQWLERNTRSGLDKITFSQFVAERLHSARDYTSVRAIYVDDDHRLRLEESFGEVVMSPGDLCNKVDRHIRPIIADPTNPDGVMQLKPLDPRLVELVPGWYPDKSPTEAISDFLYEAGLAKAGL